MNVKIKDIKQLKYGIFYGHHGIVKLRKILDLQRKKKSKTKSNAKGIVIDEAHLIVEWQVFITHFYSFCYFSMYIF